MALSPAHNNPNYGRGSHTLGDDAEDANIPALEAFLASFIDRPGLDLPRPPSVALEIHHLSSKPDTTIDHIAKLVGREPILAARIVRMANSAMYRGATACTNVKQALIRVGLKSAHDLILDAAMHMTVIRAEGFDKTLEQIRRHSSAVAWLAQLVAKTMRVEAEHAFLIGLFHDIGFSVGVVALCEFLKREKRPLKLQSQHWECLLRAHENLGAKLLQKWQLSTAITTVVGRHHTLNDAGKPQTAVAVQMLGEVLAGQLGWGLRPAIAQSASDLGIVRDAETESAECFDAALAAVGMSREKLEGLKKDAEQMLLMLDAQFKE